MFAQDWRTRALAVLGHLARLRGEPITATALLEQSLVYSRAVGDRWAEGRALEMLAVGALHDGDLETAELRLEQSASVSRSAEDRWSLGLTLNALGDVARLRGQTDRAASVYVEALELQRLLAMPGPCAIIQSNLGHLYHQDDHDLRALSLFAEALPSVALYCSDGDVIGCLVGVSGVCLGLGHPARAALLFGAIEAWLEQTGKSLWPTNRVAFDRDVETTRNRSASTASARPGSPVVQWILTQRCEAAWSC